jgi:hypothetical protein
LQGVWPKNLPRLPKKSAIIPKSLGPKKARRFTRVNFLGVKFRFSLKASSIFSENRENREMAEVFLGVFKEFL